MGTQLTVAPPQHLLHFFPDLHGHRSFRPIFEALRLGSRVKTVRPVAESGNQASAVLLIVAQPSRRGTCGAHWDMRNENPSNMYSRVPSFTTGLACPLRTR